MADDKTTKSLDAEKTVLIRPGASGFADGATELHNQHRSGHASAAEETTILAGDTAPNSGHSVPPAQSYSPHTPSDPETLRINPQSPLGHAMSDAQAQTQNESEAGYTRVIRPSVSSSSGDRSSSGLAADDLEKLQKEGPVVGWFVVLKGAGKGLARPIYYGNNTVGRDGGQRVPLNFGDDAISSEEQVYVRYDSADRSYLLIPNLAKSNLVVVNQQRPTAPIALSQGDIVEIGQTVLMFVPLCSSEFDWADIEGQ